MKFILKVLVLGFLVIVSKLAKDDAIASQTPLAKEVPSQNIFTTHAQPEQVPFAETGQSANFVKFEKGSLQIN